MLSVQRDQGVAHTPDFLWTLVSYARLMRLSLKERRTRYLVQCLVQEIRGISLGPRISYHAAPVVATGAAFS
jgi:hypothetical protein